MRGEWLGRGEILPLYGALLWNRLFLYRPQGFAGFAVQREGQPSNKALGVVANHSSWLDIFVLNSGQRIYFVSKAEVDLNVRGQYQVCESLEQF